MAHERRAQPVAALTQLRFALIVALESGADFDLRIEGKDPLAVLKLVVGGDTIVATPIDRYSEDAAAAELWGSLRDRY